MTVNTECLAALESVMQKTIDGQLGGVAISYINADGTPGNVVVVEDGGTGAAWCSLLGSLELTNDRVRNLLRHGIVASRGGAVAG